MGRPGLPDQPKHRAAAAAGRSSAEFYFPWQRSGQSARAGWSIKSLPSQQFTATPARQRSTCNMAGIRLEEDLTNESSSLFSGIRRNNAPVTDIHQQSGECIFCILNFDLHILHICCIFCIFCDKLEGFFYLTYFAYFFAYSAYFLHILCHILCIFYCIFFSMFCIFYILICIFFAYSLHIICIFYCIFYCIFCILCILFDIFIDIFCIFFCILFCILLTYYIAYFEYATYCAYF
jgi:hypothetical protein